MAADEHGVAQAPSRGGKFLTFRLAGDQYGIGILKVQEIIGMLDVTAVPRTPSYVKGVINLRGKVVPVLDLRLKFGMAEAVYNQATCIVVVRILGAGQPLTMGLIVDEVCEVLDIASDQVEGAPEFGARMENEFILGIGKIGQNVFILLDIEKVVSEEDLGAASTAAGG